MATDRATPPARTAPAVVLAGRYRLERPLGAGGMASVWLARDTVLDRQVAAKLIAEALAGERSWLQRFGREARAIAALNHPNVVRVFDLGSEDGRPFMVMEYLAGGNLAERLAAEPGAPARAGTGGGPLARRLDGRRVAVELLRGAAHIHEAGLLHRDIKPSNILIADDGGIVLSDFGAVWVPDATQLTAAGDVLGTARYMAPELLRGEPAGVASELYACGRVIAAVERALGPDPGLDALAAELTAPEATARPRSAKSALRLLAEHDPPAPQAAPRRPPETTLETTVLRRRGRGSRAQQGERAPEPDRSRPAPADAQARERVAAAPAGPRAAPGTTQPAAARAFPRAEPGTTEPAAVRAFPHAEPGSTEPAAAGALAPRRVLQAPSRRVRGGLARTTAAARRGGRSLGRAGPQLSRGSLAALSGIAAMVVVVLVIAAGEGSAPPPSRQPSPAPRNAPLKAQLGALRREVRAAAGR